MKQKIISIFNENDFEDNSYSYCIKSFYNSTSKIIKEYKEKDFYFQLFLMVLYQIQIEIIIVFFI